MAIIRDPKQPDMTSVASARPFADERLPLVCFSHLRWGFVWQRPQHLLTRLARDRKVYIVEEPLLHSGEQGAELHVTESAGVTVLTPCLSDGSGLEGGFSSKANEIIRSLLTTFLVESLGVREAIAWYYTPMALGALPSQIAPTLTVYDVMDELANFRGAPADLRRQEQALFAQADVVFTGGPSLYEARRRCHPNVHCFPSGVEATHFSRRVKRTPQDIASLPHPLVGFYGVIDERVDATLLEHMAVLRPEWSFVLVGPVLKIDERDLAHAPNIHYLGMRAYQELPTYLAALDVAILPFACNEATRFISPTKTLEYLAGGKPVVSTPIKDVVDLYGDVVEVAAGADAFVAAVERSLGEPRPAHGARSEQVARILAEHDWDAIANQMHQLVMEALPSFEWTDSRLTPAIAQAGTGRPKLSFAGREVAD